MASGNHNKTIKHNPELFSDEEQTLPERLLEAIEAQKKQQTITDLAHAAETLAQHLSGRTDDEALSAEQHINNLLDKYYNGDRDADASRRFANKALYKQQLIKTLRHYGIEYVEKHHYPLSSDEKHIIRMDFYGSINRPRFNKLTSLYQTYLRNRGRSDVAENQDEVPTTKKRGRSKISVNPSDGLYPLNAYDLNTSPAWKLFRLFPRFHKLENRMLKTIQALKISPEHLQSLSVYDFSDILYRTYRKTEDSPDAHLFLGARQAFIKDIFRKNETWIRDYLQRHNVHPRYIDALIKSAQSKGITGSVTASTDANTYMCEFAVANTDEFQKFIINSIRSDNYAAEIQQQIQNDDYTIQGATTLHFLQNNRTGFENFTKKQLLENNYIDILLRQFERSTPPYVISDIQNYVRRHQDDLLQYLEQQEKNPNLMAKQIIKNLPNLKSERHIKIIKSFIMEHQDDFFVSLLESSRSTEYARFALNSLSDTPILGDYAKDMLTSFITAHPQAFSEAVSPEMLDSIKSSGLRDEQLAEIAPFFKDRKQELKDYFKNNNVLTVNELKNELIESAVTGIQTGGLNEEDAKFNKNFVLGNTSLFKNWYIHFHTKKYKEEAAVKFKQIAATGIDEDNESTCRDFIRERLNNFVEFAAARGITSMAAIKSIQTQKLSDKPEIDSAAHDFIVKYSSTFKNFLLQKRLQNKETNFDIMLKKIKTQGISSQNIGLIHKFIIDNQALYAEAIGRDSQINHQAQQIYLRTLSAKNTDADKNILKSYLKTNICNYLIFQQDDAQLLPYVQNIADNVKHIQLDPTAIHWLKSFTIAHEEDFAHFMTDKGGYEAENGTDIFNNIKFAKGNASIDFGDGYVMKLNLTVHHKHAVKDTADKKLSMENIASINNFSNLCLFTDFWHKIMHSLDCTEPVEDKERFVSRLMPSDSDIIFFGGEQEQDKLYYDYESDPRSKRTNIRLDALLNYMYGYEQ